MLHYILQTIAFQLFFLLIYDAFLKKETFFNWNRAYLLITTLLSVSLPFIKVERFKTVVPEEFIIRLPEVVIGNVTAPEIAPSIAMTQAVEQASLQWSWLYVLYAGMLIATVLLLYKSYKIQQLIQNNPKRWNGNLILVQVLQSSMAFSFFNYIFLGENIKPSERTTILNHEMVHVKHKHSLDLLVFELLRIVFWFNPLIYMYQNRIASLHEFIADAEAVKQNDKSKYYQNLLSQAFDTENVSFINPFFKQSLIKKRIIMLSKSKSKQVHLLKYALLIPMVFGMLLYTSCEKQIIQQELSDEVNLEDFTYSLKIYEEISEEKEKIKKAQIDFLEANPNEYASISEIDFKNKQAIFRVTLIKEVDDSYSELGFNKNSTKLYKSYSKIIGVENINLNNKDLKIDNVDESIEIPFSVIENVPSHSSCESFATNDERKTCFSNFISNFVAQNYNTNIAKENGLSGKMRINVIFKIDTKGNVVDVMSRAPHPALETEAKRVINSLPKFIPGTQRGKAVVVPYSLPILFQVNE